MNLWKTTGTIGGLTMVSRILGFAREMIFARVMGAGMAADAFALAFLIPNLFRRLFGEGAFSQGFVPLFSQRLHGEGGMEEARRFAEEVQAVFLPMLMAITLVFVIAMPAFVALIGSGWRDEPAKFAFAVELSRITFPYMLLISMVSLLVGGAQLADPIHRRRLRAGLAQRRPDRLAAAGSGRRAGDGEGDGLGRGRRRRASIRPVLDRGPARRREA